MVVNKNKTGHDRLDRQIKEKLKNIELKVNTIINENIEKSENEIVNQIISAFPEMNRGEIQRLIAKVKANQKK